MVGVKWTGISTIILSALQYIQVAVLTKFLTPSDFGIMAMAIVVIGLAQSYTDMGISNAIIQRQDTTKDHLSSLYWLEIMAGLGLFMIMILLTPPVVMFFREPRLTEVMAFTSLAFLITPMGQQFQILMQKELEFKTLARIDISSMLVSVALSIVAAYYGLGVMALVFGQLIFYGFRSMQFVAIGLRRWKPLLHFRVSDLKGYLSFGLYQMGERTVTYLSINIINIIIGRFLGPDALGHYSLAYQLIINPILRVSTMLMTVAFPIFSKFQDDNGSLRNGYIHLTRLISFFIFPILALIFIIAPVFVPVVLGPTWGDVAPLIQILCIVGLFKALGIPTVPTYLAKGHADLGFFWNLFVAIVSAILFYATARYGIMALCWSFAILSLIQFIIIQTITGDMIRLRWGKYLGSMARQSLITMAIGVILYGAGLLGRSLGWGQLALFTAIILAFIVVAILLNLIFNGDYCQELKRLLSSA